MRKFKLKEYVAATFLVVLHFSLWYYFAYIKYRDVKLSDYKYIFGLPEWFFYSAVVVSIVIIILVIIITNILFNDEIKEEENV